MSRAPLWLAIVLVLLVAANARPDAAKADVGGPALSRHPRQYEPGSGSGRVVAVLVRPTLQILTTTLRAWSGGLEQLAAFRGRGAVVPLLFRASASSSSGGSSNPEVAAVSEEVVNDRVE